MLAAGHGMFSSSSRTKAHSTNSTSAGDNAPFVVTCFSFSESLSTSDARKAGAESTATSSKVNPKKMIDRLSVE